MYHHGDILGPMQIHTRDLGDSIAFFIRKQLHKFGSNVISMFADQFYHMNYIPIGLEGYTIQIYQMHISKNSYIRSHVDVFD
jgi:hypothetical protein